jgi:hypothetical protein
MIRYTGATSLTRLVALNCITRWDQKMLTSKFKNLEGARLLHHKSEDES